MIERHPAPNIYRLTCDAKRCGARIALHASFDKRELYRLAEKGDWVMVADHPHINSPHQGEHFCPEHDPRQ